MLSPSQFAEQIGKPYQTVMTWLKKERIKGVQKTEVGKMVVYLIPSDADYTEPSMGRPPKPKDEGTEPSLTETPPIVAAELKAGDVVGAPTESKPKAKKAAKKAAANKVTKKRSTKK